MPEACAFQVVPPSVVATMPLSPTAQPSVALAKATEKRATSSAGAGTLCGLQVAPPSVLARMMALLPSVPTVQT